MLDKYFRSDLSDKSEQTFIANFHNKIVEQDGHVVKLEIWSVFVVQIVFLEELILPLILSGIYPGLTSSPILVLTKNECWTLYC